MSGRFAPLPLHLLCRLKLNTKSKPFGAALPPGNSDSLTPSSPFGPQMPSFLPQPCSGLS